MEYTTTRLRAVRHFLDGPHRTVLATVRKDGSPHLVVVDYIVDGESLLLNGRADRSWVAHLRRDGRASALVHDPDNVQHWVSIVGTAELVREGDEAAVEDAKVMARRYGDDPEQFTGQHRVTWRLVPTRVIERGDS